MTGASSASPSRRRVVITGMGAVAGDRVGCGQFWHSLVEGRSTVRPITHFDVSDYRTRIASCLEPSSLPRIETRVSPSLCDLGALAALACAREALQESGLETLPERTAILFGSGVGGIRSLDEQFCNFYTQDKRKVMPFTVARTMMSAASALLSIELDVRGPVHTVSTACSSSSHAMGWAYQMISQGRVEVCLSGGTDCPVAPGHLQAWDRLRALAADNETPRRACRPFSRNRAGLVLGEGAGVLVLEEREHARGRGAPVLAEVCGYGTNSDAHHMLQPLAETQSECMRQALQSAPAAVPDYICAHGTATPEGDLRETEAIHACLGAGASRIAVSSIKSVIGHTLGASGALAAVATVMAMHEGRLPPTINLEEPDPECDLDYVPNRARPADVRLALVNAFAFGGSNAVLALAAP